MNYLLNTQHLQYCELAFSLYKNWYDFNEIDTGNNTLPINKEIRETYERLPSNEWLMKYESMFIKTFETMIIPTEHDDKIWLYKNIKPNETRMYGLDIEGIAAVTAIEVRTWKFIIDNLPFYEKYLFTDNSENKETIKQNGKNMNLDLLDGLFVPGMTRGANPTKLELLKTDLRANVCIYKGKQITALADVIYKSQMLHKNTKPNNFTKWLKQFCEIIDFPLPTYKQNAVKSEFDTLKKTYHYLIP